MAIDISSTTRRIVYTGSAGVGPYAFNFEVLAQTDIDVYFNDTALTLTTDFTVSINVDGTGSVTIVTGTNVPSTPTASDRITIVGARTIERTTDFTTGGPLFATSLNDEFDSLTIFTQQNKEEVDRAIKAPVTDPSSIDMTLPKDDDRKGKYLSFNASTGNPEVVNTVTDVTTIAGIAGDVTTVSGIAANVTTVAGNSANVTTVATNISAVNTVATNIADVITVANDLNEAISEIETAANDLNEAVSEIDTVSNSISNVDAVGTNITNVNTVATNIANVNTVAGISANVTTVAGVSADVATVAGISADVTTVAADGTDIGTVAGISANVTTVAGVAANVTTVAGVAANVTTVAGISSDVTTVATNVADITNFSDVYLGPKASDPSVRNDASALQAGDLYFNTSGNVVKAYTGSAWEVAFSGGSGYLQTSNNLSDLGDAALAVSNLGISATAAELNVLDGITASTAELNYTDGVTSNIQTQLDAKIDETSATGSAVIPSGTEAERDGSPAAGYLRFNSDEGSFEGYDGSAWGSIGGGASAGGAIYENTDDITANYTITTGSNGLSVGPITIASGVTVTVPSGQRWVVL
jgi:tetrahydromethanopterin S-methyltransferase subunit B